MNVTKNVTSDGFQLKYSLFSCPKPPAKCDGVNADFAQQTDFPTAVYL